MRIRSVHCLLQLLVLGATGLSAQGGDKDPASPVFKLTRPANPLPPLEDPPELETPQAAVEHFVDAANRNEFDVAARALNLRLIDDVDESRATELAARLFYVLNQEIWLDWTLIPDRADGMDPGSRLGGNDPMAGRPRRWIVLDRVSVGRRDAAIAVQRVVEPGRPPRWLIADRTVQNIDDLYDAHGPPWIERNIPEWLAVRGWGRVPLWQWAGLMLVIVVGGLLAWALTRFSVRLIRTLELDAVGRIAERLRVPIAAVAFSIFVAVAVRWGFSLPGPVSTLLDPAVLALLIVSICWLASRISGVAIDHLTRGIVDDDDEAVERRQHKTRLTIARHVITLLIGAIGASVLLMQLDAFHTIGVVLLTSAGAAAVIIGLAGQPVLGNAIAGIQIAFTQPFRIGDTVQFDGNWGRIEKITYTYVDVKSWDGRRFVVPIRHFLTHPIENWSKNELFLIRPIYLRVDFLADVDAIRDKFLGLASADEDCDAETEAPKCLVTATDDEALTVRLTAGAKDPSTAWNLGCRLREQMCAWLREHESGGYLPRRRFDVRRSVAAAQSEG